MTPSAHLPANDSIARKVTLAVLWTFVIGGGIFFIVRDVPKYATYEAANYHEYWRVRWWLLVHVAAAGPALILAPLQFVATVRRRWPWLHRRIGWAYAICCLIGSIGAFRLAGNSECILCRPSLAILAALWLGSTTVAALAARRRDFSTHRAFMVRSVVYINVFVYIRLAELVPLPSLDEGQNRILQEWLCLILPLLGTELYLVWWPAIRLRHRNPGTSAPNPSPDADVPHAGLRPRSGPPVS
jgi:hypothetical protein